VEEFTKNSGLRRFRRNRLHSAARTNLETGYGVKMYRWDFM
jgi:hypothetical protein